MSSTSISGTISIESHSKQVKLLNDYILSLQKKLNQGRESDSTRMIKLSDEANRLNDQNIKLKNQISQLKYHLYKHQETARRNTQLEKELVTLTQQFQNLLTDKNTLAKDHQNLKEHLATCELHMRAAEKQINDRTELFKKDASHLTDIIEELRGKIEVKDKRCSQLEARLQGETKRMKFQLLKNENICNQRIKQKNQSIESLNEYLEKTKNVLEEKIQQLTVQVSENEQKDKLLTQKGNQFAALLRQNNNLNHQLIQLNDANSKLQNQLANKIQEFDRSLKSNNQEKSNLVRIVRRLQEEKKMLQSINSAAKGDVSLQLQQNKDLIRHNEALSVQLTQKNSLIAVLEQQRAALIKTKEQLLEQLKMVLENLNRAQRQRDQKQCKIEQLEQAYIKLKKELTLNIANSQHELDEKLVQIERLNARAREQEIMIDTLELQKQQANTEVARIMQMMGSKQIYFENQIGQLEEELRRKREDIKSRQEALTSLKAEYQTFQSKKEAETQMLNTRIANFISDQSLLKNQSDSTTKDFLNFKQTKEAEIITLNQNVKELSKEKATLDKDLQKIRQQYSSFKKRKEVEVDDLNARLRDLQKEHSALKDNLDTLNRQYYTYQKKKETDIDHLGEKIKEMTKKVEKRELKIQQLEQQKKQVEAIYQTSKKNMSSSQQQELERLKDIYLSQNNTLKHQISQQAQRNDQITLEKQQLQKRIGQLEEQLKLLREELKAKQKSNADIQRTLEKERNELLNQIKSLNISTLMAGQIKSTKQIQIQTLKKTNHSLQNFITENKRHIENLSALLKEKEKELQTLENSNTMLRKQLISSLNNEQNTRKEVAEIRRTGSMIMPPQRMRQKARVLPGKSNNSPELTLSKAGRIASSIVESREGSNSGDKGLKTFNTKSSIIDDIQLQKDEQQLPIRESNRSEVEKLRQI